MITKLYGPPGTGKTTRLLRCINESAIPFDRILFVSFTKKAVSVAKERAKESGASDNDLVWFRTQHSVNFRLLGCSADQMAEGRLSEFAAEYNYRLSKKLFSLPEESAFADLDENEGRHDFLFLAQQKARDFSVPLTELIAADARLRPFHQSILKFEMDYRAWKEEHDYLDFNDLLEEGCRRGLVPDVDLFILDEAQDCTPLQMKQIDYWAKMLPQTIIAGDPDQAIYTFGGAAPRLFNDFPADHVEKLEVSFRLPRPIRDLALQIIRKNPNRVDIDFQPAKHEGKIIRVNSFIRVVDALSRTAELKNRRILILARENWLIKEALKELRRAGLPCGGSRKKLETVSLILRRPKILVASDMAILINSFFKVGIHWKRGAKAEIERRLEKGLNPVPVGELEKWGALPVLVSALENGSLAMLHFGGKNDAEELRYYRTVVEKYEGRLDILRCSTIHAAKGDEGDSVILLTSVSRRNANESAFGEDREAERRVWYVAASRAKESLVIVDGGFSKFSTREI